MACCWLWGFGLGAAAFLAGLWLVGCALVLVGVPPFPFSLLLGWLVGAPLPHAVAFDYHLDRNYKVLCVIL